MYSYFSNQESPCDCFVDIYLIIKIYCRQYYLQSISYIYLYYSKCMYILCLKPIKGLGIIVQLYTFKINFENKEK